jgi:hypothetical protein
MRFELNPSKFENEVYAAAEKAFRDKVEESARQYSKVRISFTGSLKLNTYKAIIDGPKEETDKLQGELKD